jgi:hypothetical protein
MTSSRQRSTPKTLRQLYSEHQGKVSDKWTSYLDEYDRILTEYRDRPVRLLEIGVQNGGSLEIWSRYFPKARRIVGCDLDPACASLTFDDPRIALVIGDANSDAVQQSILGHESAFEIIIDDGSHHARDIVDGFARYFPHLTFGGVYIAEDLHCSYWREYGGGLHEPFSPMAFFKRLADTLNHEHWGIQKSRGDILSGFSAKYGSHIPDEALQAVRSVQFMNSVCAIRKEKPETNVLQSRVVAGSVATVFPEVLKWRSDPAPVMDQAGNEVTVRPTLSEEEIGELLATVQAHREQTSALEVDLAARDSVIRALQNSRSWRITAPLRAVSPGARWFLWNARRALKLARWLGTGQFRRGLRAILPYYQGYVPPRLKAMMPRRVRGALKRSLIDGNSAKVSLVDCSLEVPLRYVEALRPADGPVAAIVHMFYPDLAEELRSYLENIPGAVDLFISATGESERSLIESVFSGWSKGRVDIRIVPNRGRDWAPKLVSFRDVYDSYTYVLCLHTKRSLHQASLSGWRRFLLENLLGNEAIVSSVFAAFERNPRLGIVAPPHFGAVRSAISWGVNLGAGTSMAARMGFAISETVLDFPSGSMFWARSAALRPLLDLQLVTEDFEEEVSPPDGTLAHAIERLVFFACEKAGFDWIKVGRPELSAGGFTVRVRDERELDQFFERHVRRLLGHRAVQAHDLASPRVGTRIDRGRASSDIPRVAVCLIAKNEARYLVEWMAYYVALGFDEVLIYDNGSSDATAEIVGRAIANDSRIRYVPWPDVPGVAPQIPAYNDALRKTRADWIAFVDIDEFIVLKEHASIGECSLRVLQPERVQR